MQDDSLRPDQDLWNLFLKGDKHAFKILHARYYTVLFRFGYKMIKDEAFLEDTLQDLFLKLWQKRDTLSNVQHVKNYLFRSYNHLLIDALKRERKTIGVPIEGIELKNEDPNIEEWILNQQHLKDQRQELQQAFKKLSARQKEVLYLFYVKGFDYRKIEETLCIRYQSVRNCMHAAIKNLRSQLSKDSILVLFLYCLWYD